MERTRGADDERVLAQRPADGSGELHGLYEPDDAGKPARITVWMRTAARMGAARGPAFHGRGFDMRIGPPLGREWADVPRDVNWLNTIDMLSQVIRGRLL